MIALLVATTVAALAWIWRRNVARSRREWVNAARAWQADADAWKSSSDTGTRTIRDPLGVPPSQPRRSKGGAHK